MKYTIELKINSSLYTEKGQFENNTITVEGDDGQSFEEVYQKAIEARLKMIEDIGNSNSNYNSFEPF